MHPVEHAYDYLGRKAGKPGKNGERGLMPNEDSLVIMSLLERIGELQGDQYQLGLRDAADALDELSFVSQVSAIKNKIYALQEMRRP